MRFAAFAAIAAVSCALPAAATVINFDDLGNLTDLASVSYAGVTWGVSFTDTFGGNQGSFVTYNNTTYAQAASAPNYVYNGWGAQDLTFTFDGGPVTTFDGAYFALAGASLWANAARVRMLDDLGNFTGWLDLTAAPQYLACNFAGSTTIKVQYDGTGPQQYTMDDVTYNTVPEPTSLATIGLGIAGLIAKRRRK